LDRKYSGILDKTGKWDNEKMCYNILESLNFRGRSILRYKNVRSHVKILRKGTGINEFE
jgi:hypothetical protein